MRQPFQQRSPTTLADAEAILRAEGLPGPG
jgi:hypothetical protein